MSSFCRACLTAFFHHRNKSTTACFIVSKFITQIESELLDHPSSTFSFFYSSSCIKFGCQLLLPFHRYNTHPLSLSVSVSLFNPVIRTLPCSHEIQLSKVQVFPFLVCNSLSQISPVREKFSSLCRPGIFEHCLSVHVIRGNRRTG